MMVIRASNDGGSQGLVSSPGAWAVHLDLVEGKKTAPGNVVVELFFAQIWYEHFFYGL
jgi:hypothetical protein